MKKYFILLSLLILSTNNAYASEFVEDYCDMANNFYNSREYTKAIEYTNAVLNIEPENSAANHLILKLTNPKKYSVETLLDRQIIIRPVLSNSDDLSTKHNLKGEKYYDEKDFNNAKLSFLESIKANKKNKYAYNNLGLTYWRLEDYRKAKKSFKKSFSIDKSFIVPLNNYAIMSIERGDLKTARKTLEKTIALNYNNHSVHYLLGLLNKEECKYDEAINQFNIVTQISKDFPFSYLHLGDTYHTCKDYSLSNLILEKYITLCPKDDFAYYLMYQNYYELKDYSNAKSSLLKAIKLNDIEDYRFSLARLEFELKNYNFAIDILRTIEDPSSSIINELGQYYLVTKEYKKALDCFDRSYRSKSSRPIYLYNYALTQKQIGNSEACKKAMSEMFSIVPKTYQDYIDLSIIYLDCECKNKALIIINYGIEKFPCVKELYEAKVKIYTLTKDSAGEKATKAQIQRIFKD